MIPKEFFHWIVSLSGLAFALFMYWHVVRMYHKNKLRPFTWVVIVYFILLGAGLNVFNHFLTLALNNTLPLIDWGVRGTFVLVLGLCALVIYKQTKVVET